MPGHYEATLPVSTNILLTMPFDIPKRKRKTDVHHYRQANDLWAAVKALEGVFLHHMRKLRNRPARLKSVSSDTADE
jgi:hypothetical protein